MELILLILLIPYIMFVTAGWLHLVPGDNFIVDAFVSWNRKVNRNVFRSKTGKTISADAYNYKKWYRHLINLFALDWNHCKKYKDI